MEELNNLHNSESEDTSYDHVLKYTGIFGGVQGLKLLVSVLRTKITTMILGPVGMGMITVYNRITEFVVSCSNCGIPLNATRVMSELFEEGTQDEIRHRVEMIRTWICWTAAAAALLCIALSPLLSYLFFDHEWRHFLEIVAICPIAICLLVAEGECSILKGLRQLKRVAWIETLSAFTTLLLTVPFYYLWELRGIIIALNISTAASAGIHLYFTSKLVRYKVSPLSRSIFREGLPMIRQGIPYVLAGIANSGLGMAIPAMLLLKSTMDEVGFYGAGYSLMVGYAGMAFVALEADYYPRLSSVCHDRLRMNLTINQQIDVCVMLITPFLILYLLCMPVIIPLLYDGGFMVILDMVICAVFYMFFRAIYLPIAYTALGKGDSMLFLTMEVLYDLVFGGLMWWMYSLYGLLGAGVALSMAALYDVVSALVVYGWRYGCRVRRSTLLLCAFQFVCLAGVMVSNLYGNSLVKYGVGGLLLLASLWRTFAMLKKRSDIVRRLMRRR